MKTHQEEQNQLLDSILDGFYTFWKGDNDITRYNALDTRCPSLEFYVTPVCNQACSYCYLIKHGKELYPEEIRDTEQILKNLKIYLNFLSENKYIIPRLDLFSGEIWGMELGSKVLYTILSYMRKGLVIKSLMIPSNFSFITDETATKVMQYFIYEFDKLGCRLCLSASIDGQPIDKAMRPFRGKGVTDNYKDDKYYENIFKFCGKNGFGFHPMVSAASVKYWKENYVWWHEILEKYNIATKDPKSFFTRIMMLEVRNDEWDDESILDYLKLLKFAMDYDFNKYFQGTPEVFYYFLLSSCSHISYKDSNKDIKNEYTFGNYIFYSLSPSAKTPGCSVAQSLCIRLGDLAIAPCHRTSYDKLLYGKYIVEDDKITGIEAINPLLANRIYNQTFLGSFKCDTCPDIYCCKGCYGAQFEANSELFYPCKSVCELEIAKHLYLLLYKAQFIQQHPEINEKVEPIGLNDRVGLNGILTTEEGKKWIEIIKKNLF